MFQNEKLWQEILFLSNLLKKNYKKEFDDKMDLCDRNLRVSYYS